MVEPDKYVRPNHSIPRCPDCALKPAIIWILRGQHGLTKLCENFGGLPFPLLNVAIGEGQIPRLVMAVGRQIEPDTFPYAPCRRDSEKSIENFILVNVDKNKALGR